jgi:hypothetical protein
LCGAHVGHEALRRSFDGSWLCGGRWRDGLVGRWLRVARYFLPRTECPRQLAGHIGHLAERLDDLIADARLGKSGCKLFEGALCVKGVLVQGWRASRCGRKWGFRFGRWC